MIKPSSEESLWKRWVDRILMLDLFLVILGSIFLVIAFILSFLGYDFLMNFFQILWKPLFLPLITILISASLVNGLLAWWQRQEPLKDLEN